MNTQKPFQLISIGLAIFFAIIGLFVFAFKGSKPKEGVYQGPKTIVWGTLSEKTFNDTAKSASGVNIIYTQKNPDTLSLNLLEALAGGTSPDLLVIPIEDVLTFKNRIVTIPFKNYPERTFKDNFIDEADLLKINDGYMGLPVAVDPIVMYYNRDHLNTAGIISVPKTWSEILASVPKFTIVNNDFSLTKQAVAFGEFDNIMNAKDIFSLLLLQSGEPIVTYSYNSSLKKDVFEEKLDTSGGSGLSPVVLSLNFYTQFVDPTKVTYSWNRSLNNSLDEFLAGDLTYYLGFGSERKDIEVKNPNLNFDMAMVPQSDSANKSTYGKLYVAVLLNTSKNQGAAYANMQALTAADFAKRISEATALPPVRRDLLLTPPSDLYSAVLYQSSFYAKGWLDPNPKETASIWKEMIEAVTSGRKQSTDAIRTANDELNLLLK